MRLVYKPHAIKCWSGISEFWIYAIRIRKIIYETYKLHEVERKSWKTLFLLEATLSQDLTSGNPLRLWLRASVSASSLFLASDSLCCIWPQLYYQPPPTPHTHPLESLAPHSSTLAWKIPWTEEPGRLQSMLRVGHYWETSLSLFTFIHWSRKW